MNVGWIGIGRMGRPMVENLVRAGHDVVVQNRSQGKVLEMVAMGATTGGSFAEMAASVESIHLCLFHWVLNDVFARINSVGRYHTD